MKSFDDIILVNSIFLKMLEGEIIEFWFITFGIIHWLKSCPLYENSSLELSIEVSFLQIYFRTDLVEDELFVLSKLANIYDGQFTWGLNKVSQYSSNNEGLVQGGSSG